MMKKIILIWVRTIPVRLEVKKKILGQILVLNQQKMPAVAHVHENKE